MTRGVQRYSRNPKRPRRVQPGRGWFSWLWGGRSRHGDRVRYNVPAYWFWEKQRRRKRR